MPQTTRKLVANNNGLSPLYGLILERGLKFSFVAKQVGVSNSLISLWLHHQDKYPIGREYIPKLAKVLGMTQKELRAHLNGETQ